jgi:hypothetical protein
MRNIQSATKGIASLFLLVASLVSSQAQEKVPTERKAQRIQDGASDPAGTSATSTPAAQLVLSGSKDNTSAKAQVGVALGDFVVQVKGNIPVSGTDSTANIADLSGLSAKATADIGVTYVLWNPKPKDATTADNVQRDACARFLIDTGKAADRSAALQMMSLPDPKFFCTFTNLPKGSSYRSIFNESIDWGTPVLVSARYTGDHEQYKYAVAPAFASQTKSATSYGLSAAAGVIAKPGLLQLDYQYASTYSAQPSSQVCVPVSGSSATTCQTIATAAPKRKITSTLALESRFFFGRNVGLAPKVSGDLRGKVASFEVPVYLLHDKTGGLNGGATFGWRSDTKEFTAGVFVGDILTLLSSK